MFIQDGCIESCPFGFMVFFPLRHAEQRRHQSVYGHLYVDAGASMREFIKWIRCVKYINVKTESLSRMLTETTHPII
jgi:hypothetical protein